MSVAVVTGSGGLIGSEAAIHFAAMGLQVVGIDNDMRQQFFGVGASTEWNVERLGRKLGACYRHYAVDVRDRSAIEGIFRQLGEAVDVVIHTAAQPSHDWAAGDPYVDFAVNAVGTLVLLEAARRYCPAASFIFTSTNKVYGDAPNRLLYDELPKRFEIPDGDRYAIGIDESMAVDRSLHSVFGASKLAADVMVQEYGRYFGLNTVCFRGGTLTGSSHSPTELHGFLAYMLRCCVTRNAYTVYGYRGKQVRDVLDSRDVVRAFEAYFLAPTPAAVYNLGGGRLSNCSVLEAIELCEEVAKSKLEWQYSADCRTGDHIWWISDNGSFERDYPEWCVTYDVEEIAKEIYDVNRVRWSA